MTYKELGKIQSKIDTINRVFNPSCPSCGSRNNYFRSKMKTWVCRKCGSVYHEKNGRVVLDES